MPITIGSGAITGLSAGGLPDASITQADLAANVAGNGPCFSAYQSVAQSIASGPLVKLQLQAEEFDANNYFDSVTNFRFQPLVAGYYLISGACCMSAPAAQVTASIYKNGLRFKDGIQHGTAASSGFSATVSALIQFNGSSDYVELWVAQSSGGAVNSLANPYQSYFQGFLARSAT